jgi:hypothetical protein
MTQLPTQTPFVTPSFDTDLLNEVRHEVFGTKTALATAQEDTLKSLGEDAFFDVTEIGKWYNETDPTTEDLSNIWNELFKLRWVQRAMRHFRSTADAERFEQLADRQEARLAQHYAINWGAASALADDSINPVALRNSVLSVIIRQRTPWYPPIELVDRIMREEFVKLWNERRWEFTKRNARFSIGTNGTVCATDATGGGLVFDGMCSNKIWIKPSTTGLGVRPCVFLDANRFAEAAAAFDGRTGRPRHFHDFDEGDIKRIAFIPQPDAVYTAFGIIYIAAPQFNPSTGREGLKLLPVEFRASLRDYIVAKVMHFSGREDTDAARALTLAQSERAQMAQAWDDKGASRFDVRPQIDRRWWSTLQSRQFTSVVGSLG